MPSIISDSDTCKGNLQNLLFTCHASCLFTSVSSCFGPRKNSQKNFRCVKRSHDGKSQLSFFPSYLEDLIVITGELELLPLPLVNCCCCACIERQQQGPTFYRFTARGTLPVCLSHSLAFTPTHTRTHSRTLALSEAL